MMPTVLVSRRLREREERYKLEILGGIKSTSVTFYHLEHWSDLCVGPHVSSTGELVEDAIELESVAGVYWRGDETNLPMLQVLTP